MTPSATYRLQFRGEMTLDRAAALVPYLRALGVSHLYASPLTRAAPGSTHGYDVADFGTIEPAIGGEAGLRTLAAALRREGRGLALRIAMRRERVISISQMVRHILRSRVEVGS